MYHLFAKICLLARFIKIGFHGNRTPWQQIFSGGSTPKNVRLGSLYHHAKFQSFIINSPIQPILGAKNPD